MRRRQFLFTFGAVLAFLPPLRARQAYTISDAERLIAAIQDGGKILYLLPDADVTQARLLGRALRALRVPLNDIRTSRAAIARRAAEAVSDGAEIIAATELDFRPDELLRTPPLPGHNRILVGQRTPLETATGRSFPSTVLPDGAMAIFVPGSEMQLLGTVTAGRVIRGAQTRGALPR